MRQLRSANAASLEDLKRQLEDVIGKARLAVKAEREDQQRREVAATRQRMQLEHCSVLKEKVGQLRRAKEEEVEAETEERRTAEERKREREKARREREEKTREVEKQLIMAKRAEEAAEAAKQRRALEAELLAKMMAKRESALRDKIRVNFRRVASAKRTEEARQEKLREQADGHAREARLESLRRFARRRLGVDAFVKTAEDTTKCSTESFEQRLRAAREERQEQAWGRRGGGRKVSMCGPPAKIDFSYLSVALPSQHTRAFCLP